MFCKIVICIPIVIKLSVIMVIIFYFYSTIGVEIFSTIPPTHYNKDGPYGFTMCNPKYVLQNQIKDSTKCKYFFKYKNNKTIYIYIYQVMQILIAFLGQCLYCYKCALQLLGVILYLIMGISLIICFIVYCILIAFILFQCLCFL